MTTTRGDLADYLSYTTIRGLSPATHRLRTHVLGRLLRIVQRDGLLDVTAGDLAEWQRIVVAPCQPESRRAYVTIVQGYYRWAIGRGHLVVDPSLHLVIPKVPDGVPRPISEADLELALASARAIDLDLYVQIRLMADAGLRCMEVAGLSRSDLDDQASPATLFVREGKGGKQRVVSVGLTVVRDIRLLGVRRGPLWPAHASSGHVTAGRVSRRVNRHLRELGIPATAHCCRHRYLTVGWQATRDMRLMMDQAGHSSPKTTARYTAWSRQSADALVAHLDSLDLAA